MYLRNRNEFGKLLKELNLNNYGIEVGVNDAKYSKILLDTTDLKRVYLLDIWSVLPDADKDHFKPCTQADWDRTYKLVQDKMAPYGDRVQIIKSDCRKAVNDFDDNYFDFIYLDANHRFAFVERDLRDWYPKLKKGGVWSGHDYLNCHIPRMICEVKKAVDIFASELKVKIQTTGGDRRVPLSWYWIKE